MLTATPLMPLRFTDRKSESQASTPISEGVDQAMQNGMNHDILGPSARAEPEAGESTGVVIARTELIGLGSGDESVVALQLAARWAEKHAPEKDDSLEETLRRFRRAYNYVNAVIKQVEPEEA